MFSGRRRELTGVAVKRGRIHIEMTVAVGV